MMKASSGRDDGYGDRRAIGLRSLRRTAVLLRCKCGQVSRAVLRPHLTVGAELALDGPSAANQGAWRACADVRRETPALRYDRPRRAAMRRVRWRFDRSFARHRVRDRAG